MRRILALFLAMVLTVNSLPVAAFAVEGTAKEIVESAVQNNDVSMEATNSLGTLLTGEIEAGQDSMIGMDSDGEDYEAGYSLSKLEISGNVAVVTYDSLEEANLVVSLYTEDGMRLLNSAVTKVIPEETSAMVTFNGEMPEYFYAAAFLLDIYDNAPLCDALETPLYTRDMQELLEMNVSDAIAKYGDEQVYNMDDSAQTNFAVYAEGTVVLQHTEGVNTVISANDDAMVYVLDNVDEQISSLVSGAVVVYHYCDDDMLIFKVDTVSVSGTTATIQGMDLELEEVFALMKLENVGDASDVVLDTSTMDENLTYNGLGSSGATTYGIRDTRADLGFKVSHDYEFKKKEGGDDPNSPEFSEKPVAISGTFEAMMKVFVDVTVNFYISTSRQFLEFSVEPGVELYVKGEGVIRLNGFKLGTYTLPLPCGVTVVMTPQMIFRLKGEAELNYTFDFLMGFTLENKRGDGVNFDPLWEEPDHDIDFKIEASLFIGLDMNPSVVVVSKRIAEAKLNATAGLEISAILEDNENRKPDPDQISYHKCLLCVDGDLGLEANAKATVTFLNMKDLKFEKVLLDERWKLGDFYFSLDNMEAGFGTCPHKAWRVLVRTLDEDAQPTANVEVTIQGGALDKELTCTSNPEALVYDLFLEPGIYTIEADINDQIVKADNVKVSTYCTVVLTASEEYWERQRQLEALMIEPDEVDTDYDSIDGKVNDNIDWILYSNGLLKITGEGVMDDFVSPEAAPWYLFRNSIKSVHIGDMRNGSEMFDGESGITYVGKNAFAGCKYLEKVILENSVTTVGLHAFKDCSNIRQLRIPVDLDYSTGLEYSFEGCTGIEKIHYTYGMTGNMNNRMNTYGGTEFNHSWSPEHFSRESLEGVYLEEGITVVGSYAFHSAEKLTMVALPETLTTIDDYAFGWCTGLQTVDLPMGLTALGKSAFLFCTGLTSVTIPVGITAIPEGCFEYCTGFQSLTIPNHITRLEARAYAGCKSITELTMPVDLVYVSQGEHYYDPGVDSPYVDKSDTYSFAGCTNIQTINFTYGSTGKMPELYFRKVDGVGSSFGHGVTILYDYYGSPQYQSRNALKNVYFSDGITSIGGGAFYECTGLETVTFPSTLYLIEHHAFYGCKNLDNLDFPASMQNAKAYAFASCSGLTSLKLSFATAEHCFFNCTGLTAVEIADSVGAVGDCVFRGCSGIKELTMPVDLRFSVSLGSTNVVLQEPCSPFWGCTNIEKITYTYGTTGIMSKRGVYGTSLVTDDYSYTPEQQSKNTLKTVVFDEKIKEIAGYVFADCIKLENVTLPERLTSFASGNVFMNCSSLTTIEIPDGVTDLQYGTFAGCSNLTELTIPVDATCYTNTFKDCTNIQKITYTYGTTGDMSKRDFDVEYSPEYISRDSLKNLIFDSGITGVKIVHCKNLETVVLPERVTSFSGSFYGCAKLSHVTLPEGITDLPEYMFYGCTNLETVELPDSLTSLGVSAFENCSSLTALNIPDGVTSIPGKCLSGCINLETVELPASLTKIPYALFDGFTKLTSVTIPDGVTTIEGLCFRNCTNLSEVKLPAKLTTLGIYAFQNCRSLTVLNIPDGVTSIPENCFLGCTNLETIKLPTSLTEIPVDFFREWTKLTEVTIPEGITTIPDDCFYGLTSLTTVVLPESLTSLGESAFSNCSGLTEINIPKGVTSIPAHCFTGCTSLTAMELPEDLTALGSNAFQNCSSLTQINIPEGITSLPNFIFDGCTNLSEIKLPEKLTTLGMHAFQDCSSLTQISIPDGVASIPDGCFLGCTNLKTIKLPASLTEIPNGFFSEFSKLTEITIPEGITTIPDSCFSGLTSLATVVLPESLTSLGQYAFMGCGSLAQISIPEGVTSIPGYCFDNCTNLETVELPASLTALGTYAFADCGSLTQINIPEGITSIPDYCFQDCTNLETVELPASLTSLGENAFAYCSSLTQISIPEGITSIPNNCFRECTNLETVELPASLTSLDENAFAHCTGLTEISIPDGVTFTHYSCFYGCDNVKTIKLPASPDGWPGLGDFAKLSKVIVPEGITTIPAYCFQNHTNLETVELPTSLTSLGENAFAYCSSLTQISIPEGITSIPNNCFQNCTNLETVELPASLTSLGEYAFENCSGLTEIYFPDGVTSVPYNCFYDCANVKTIKLPASLIEWPNFGNFEKLTKVIVPEGITTIPDYCFSSCAHLETVELPASLTSLGSGAFVSCSSLTQIRIPEGITSIPNDCFRSCTNLETVEFPESLISLGEYAFESCTSLTQISVPEGITSIPGCCFYNCTNLEMVTLPASLTSLGEYAFAYCTGLAEISIPDGVASVLDNCFYGCNNLKTIKLSASLTEWPSFYDVENLTKVIVPEGITTIPRYCFQNCANLETVELPASVTSMGEYAFADCSSLTQISIPEGVASIPEGCFMGCSGLEMVLFSGTITDIAIDAFYNVTANVLYPDDNAFWTEDMLQNYMGNLTWIPYILDENGDIVTDFFLEMLTEQPDEAEEKIGFEEEIPEEEIPEEEIPEEEIPEEEIPEEEIPEEEIPEGEILEEEIPEEEVIEEDTTDEGESIEAIGVQMLSFLLRPLALAVSAQETDVGFNENLVTVENKTEGSTSWEVVSTAGEEISCQFTVEDDNLADVIATHTASFSGLVPGAEYTLLVTKDRDTNLLDPDNLLAIDQETAAENGTLSFSYILRENAENTCVFICGASHRNLKDAIVIFPPLIESEYPYLLEPVVTYDGTELVENRDYVFVKGNVVSRSGEFTCIIRGIHNYTGLISCSYSVIPAEYINRVFITEEELVGLDSVYIDGTEYAVQTEGELRYVDLPDSNAKVMTTYTYHTSDTAADGVADHAKYPTGMQVWTLENVNGLYTSTRISELENILTYAGMSIRITGKCGIRMITAVDRTTKAALTGDGLAGYSLVEYGTVVAWANALSNSKPLTLDQSYVKSNYAYKRGVADPVFAYDGNNLQYTNVLVGFSDSQLKQDLAIRPYIILENADGEQITLYGGIVCRSIGYIAYQLRNAFVSGTDGYEYVWDIIHNVYGDIYDDEYVEGV